jgi:CMP-N,N'-diacetyllegionaminic acid synthase
VKALYLIPARGGSKGIPHKNVRKLNGKPLIYYSIDIARSFTTDENICLSTDDLEIKKVAEEYGLNVPFMRPSHLASDTATSSDAIEHAYNYYHAKGIQYDVIVLLQPTSPFRTVIDLKNAWTVFNQENPDIVLGVKIASANPYLDIYEEENGVLKKSKTIEELTRRQDAPPVYQVNGALYLIKAASFLSNNSIQDMPIKKKSIMNRINSVDIDDPIDWLYCEFLIEKSVIEVNALTNKF